MTLDDFRAIQQADQSLASVQKTIPSDKSPAENNQPFFITDGILYHVWCPGGDLPPVEQLVLPAYCRQHVLHLAHSVPLAGHLG